MARRPRIIRQRPGSPCWYCNFTVHGRRFRGSLGTDREGEAEVLAAKLRSDALLGVTIDRRPTMTLDQAFGAYWLEVGQHLASAADVTYQTQNLLAALDKATRLDRLEPREIARFIARRRAQVSDSSVNREVELLRRVLRRARDVWKVDVAMPEWKTLLLREPDEPERILSAEEEKRLFRHLRQDHHAMVRFALTLGLRVGNILGLRWDQIDEDAGLIRMRTKSKRPGGKVHVVPLTPGARAILSVERGRHPDLVFTYRNARGRWDRYLGRRVKKGERMPFSKHGWRKVWGDALAAAKIEGLRFHDLRHTAATRTLKASGNLKVVQKLLGHANIATTTRYLRAQVEDVREALQRVEGTATPPAATGKQLSGRKRAPC